MFRSKTQTMEQKNSANDYRLDLRHRLGLEMARVVQNNYRREHRLTQLFWECTLRCNVHCRHCGSDCRQIANTKDMPREDFFRVLDSIKEKMDPHKVFVIVTGGEPLVREDIELCGKGIYERGFPWGMVSNGLMLTREKLIALRKSGLHSITVSLDGLEDDHNWMRGHRDSFLRVSEALDYLVEMRDKVGLVFDVVTCVNQRTYPKLTEIRDFLINKGVKHWRMFSIFPVGRAAKDPVLQLSNEQYRGMLDFIKRTRKEGIINAAYGCEGFLGNYEGEVRDSLLGCQAGISVGSVMANGDIAACASIRADYAQGNIYRDDFLTVWENKYQQYRDRSWMRKDECADCKYFRYCKGNSMHLRDADGKLITCHLKRLL